MARHMLRAVFLVLAISMLCESRPQGFNSDAENVAALQPSTEKVPTEIFFGPVGGFVGEVEVSTGNLTVNKKKKKKKPSRPQGPRAYALISDNSFGSFSSAIRSADTPAAPTNVAVAASPSLSLSSDSVVSFNIPAEVVAAQ